MVALLAVGMTTLAAPGAAHADPASPDGTYTALQAQLDAAVRAYNDAKGRLDAATAAQATLNAELTGTRSRLADLTDEADATVVAAYKGGRLTGFATLLDSVSAGDFLDRATTLSVQLRQEDRTLRDLGSTQSRYVDELAAIDTEVLAQRTALVAVDKHRKDIETALAAANSQPSGGFGAGTASATPAPRNPDGSWPKDNCSTKDPTTTGCLTPRTLHALQEARKAGFTRYTACFRNATFGEHPLGRACDFSAHANTFLDAPATGDDKAYGDRLAAWFLANANRLAVLYVIWYRQIWLPSSGWRTYHGDGTPAGDHLNHVHLSVQ
jgi:peptidoglycan DL-endopeptidase CwlO